VRALGLRRIGESVEVADTPEMRGMTRAVRFLLRTDELAGEPAAKPAKAAKEAKDADVPAAKTEPTRAPRRRTRAEAS
jgi:hypothetical protein